MTNEVMEMAGIGQDKPNFENMERFVQKKTGCDEDTASEVVGKIATAISVYIALKRFEEGGEK